MYCVCMQDCPANLQISRTCAINAAISFRCILYTKHCVTVQQISYMHNVVLIGCRQATLVRSRDLGLGSTWRPIMRKRLLVTINSVMLSGSTRLGKRTGLGLGLGIRLVLRLA